MTQHHPENATTKLRKINEETEQLSWISQLEENPNLNFPQNQKLPTNPLGLHSYDP